MENENLDFDPYKAIAGITLDQAKVKATSIDDLLSVAGLGPVDSAITANFWGVRRNGQPLAIPYPQENTGITFFTKPRLNLSDANILSNILSVLSLRIVHSHILDRQPLGNVLHLLHLANSNGRTICNFLLAFLPS